MKNILTKVKWLAFSALLFTAVSCLNDLDVSLKDDDSFSVDNYFNNPDNPELPYKQFLAKIYGGLSLSGQAAPTGDSDLQSLVDEGFSQYLRGYWQLQELTTDEAIIAWGESDNPTIKDLNFNTWNADNKFNEAFFARVYYQISVANEFLRETTDEKLNSRKVSEDLKAKIKVMRAEARFLRALSYYHAIDLYGNSPFATEENALGSVPVMKTRAEMFDYVLNELNTIEADLPAPRANEYGRADKGALWMLKAKLLINAKVYTGQDKSTEALAAVNSVLGAGYSLSLDRNNLFAADNDVNGAQKEIIFPVRYDGVKTKSYGGMTYLIHGSTNDAVAKTLGIDFGWQGFRARKEFIQTIAGDPRVNVVSGTDSEDITDYLRFAQGKKLIKFTNKTSAGVSGQDPTFPDTDFPMFRLADVYLMYAELAVVNGKGDKATALDYINDLRKRAGANPVTLAALTPDFVLSERAKELYWEGHRRQDLIRFGKYISGYNWQWKGGSLNGSAIADYRTLFPIPTKEISSNSNLIQNPGY